MVRAPLQSSAWTHLMTPLFLSRRAGFHANKVQIFLPHFTAKISHGPILCASDFDFSTKFLLGDPGTSRLLFDHFPLV
jgi:hypothetical protein